MKYLLFIKWGMICFFLAGAIGCNQESDAHVTQINPIPVRATQVTWEEYQPNVEVTGDVRAKIQSAISFRVSGKVTERNVSIGSQVKAGDVLARIDDTEQRSELAVAQASLTSVQAVLQHKTRTYERYRDLLRTKTISKSDYDRALEELTSAQSNVVSAQANLTIALDNLSYTELRAETDGVITSLSIEVGQVVAAAQSVLTLANPNSKEAVFNVYEAYFLNGKPLSTVRIHPIATPDDEKDGEIREVSPVIETVTGTVKIKVSLPPDTSWPLGTPVTANLSQPSQKSMILPWTALGSDYGIPMVWVIDTDTSTVSMRKIQVGKYQSDSIIVDGGLSLNEWVVTDGGRFLSEGQSVSWGEK